MVSICFQSLHEVADHLLAVAARAIADVDPAGLAPGCGLPDELVKREVVHQFLIIFLFVFSMFCFADRFCRLFSDCEARKGKRESENVIT